MAEGEQNSTATLGRVLSWFGYLWVIFAVLFGLGAIEALGFNGPIASRLGSTIFPAIILIGVGRVLRKRSRVDDDAIVPDVSPAPLPTPPILPRRDTGFDFPPPVVAAPPKPAPKPAPPPKPVAVAAVQVVADAEAGNESTPTGNLASPSGRHKTSQELIDEARQRWGTRP